MNSPWKILNTDTNSLVLKSLFLPEQNMFYYVEMGDNMEHFMHVKFCFNPSHPHPLPTKVNNISNFTVVPIEVFLEY